jgi:hypothetical protein
VFEDRAKSHPAVELAFKDGEGPGGEVDATQGFDACWARFGYGIIVLTGTCPEEERR